MLDVTKTQKKYFKSESNKIYGKSKFVGVFEVRLPVTTFPETTNPKKTHFLDPCLVI